MASSKQGEARYAAFKKRSSFTSADVKTLLALLSQKEESSLCCPHCASSHVVKFGFKNDSQRFLCRSCGRSFVLSRFCIWFGSKKSPDVWARFLLCLLARFSLRRCAKVCGIDLSTAFCWRHKVLALLCQYFDALSINGRICAALTRLFVCEKGNHGKGTFSYRRALKRGRGSPLGGGTSNQVFVALAMNDKKEGIGGVCGKGRPDRALLALFSGRLSRGSTLASLPFMGVSDMAMEGGFSFVDVSTLDASDVSLPLLSVISCLDDFRWFVLCLFKGVATRYLHHYVAYFLLVSLTKDSLSDGLSTLSSLLCTTKVG